MRCPVCSTEQTFNVTTIEQAEEHYLCREGHHFQEVEFRPVPVRLEAAVVHLGAREGHYRCMHVAVWCGPPATVPVPTPEEIMARWVAR